MMWKTGANVPIVASVVSSINCCLFTINTIILWSTVIVLLSTIATQHQRHFGWSWWHPHIALHFLDGGHKKSRYNTLGTYLLCQVSISRWWFHLAWLAILHCWHLWCQSHGEHPSLAQDWLRENILHLPFWYPDVVWREVGSNCGHIHMYFYCLALPL